MIDKHIVDVFIARHAIFDRSCSRFAYELLFRSCQANACESNDETSSTLTVVSNTLLSFGLSTVSGNSPIFINFGRDLLTSTWTSLFSPSSVVIEILESVQPDPEVLAWCTKLREMGYVLALDDVIDESAGPLADLATFVKVDFRQTTREQQRALAETFLSRNKLLLAEKVESHEEFRYALELGYHYFQGFFFARPSLMQARQIPTLKMNALRLLRELNSEELDYSKLEKLIKCDVSLSYKLFKYVNSALFSRRRQISSVHEALMTLGELNARRWITLATLPSLTDGSSSELTAHALVRARFCEAVAEAAGLQSAAQTFTIGLFSLLDALMNRPLPEILAELNLAQIVTDPLLGVMNDENLAAVVFRAAKAYEEGNWEDLLLIGEHLHLPTEVMADCYLSAIRWSSEMLEIAGIPPLRTGAGSKSGEPQAHLLALNQAVNTRSNEASESRTILSSGRIS